MKKSLVSIFLIAFLSSSLSFGAAWIHQKEKTWNADWEKKYSFWVASEINENWLQQKENPFYKWQLDCAKFAYLLKIYFSYLNQLEFAIHNPQNPSKVISSLDIRWNNQINSTQSLKSFASYILSQVNTRTLPRDTVLLDITKDSILPGTILASDLKRGHTMILKDLKPSAAPLFIFATLPASEYLYESFVYPASETYFPSLVKPNLNQGGFRRLKWPQELLKSNLNLLKESQHIFSISQTQENFSYLYFFDEIQQRLQTLPLTYNDKVDYALEDLCMKVRIRVNIIIDSSHALLKLNGRSFSANEIDLFSTYSRDKDILKSIQNLDIKFNLYKMSLNSEILKKYQSLLNPEMNSNDYCWVQWADNRVEPLGSIRKKFLNQQISSDPYSSFAKRWGE